MSTVTDRDLEPARLVVGSLLRRWWIIVLATIVAAVAAFVVIGGLRDDTEGDTAVARIGLTTAIVWPFYDQATDLARTYVASSAFAEQLTADTGLPVVSVEGVVPDALAVLDVRVTSDTPEHALQLADHAAELVVAHSGDEQRALKDRDLAVLDTELADLDQRIEAFDAQVSDLSTRAADAEAALVDDPGDADLIDQAFALGQQRDTAAATLDELRRTRERTTTDRAARAAEQVNALPGTQLVRSASLDDPGSSRTALTLAVTLATLVAASVAVIVVDRRTGGVRSAWQLAQMCGAPDVVELTHADGTLHGEAALADVVHAALRAERRVVGVVDVSGALGAAALADLLDRQAIRASLATTADHAPASEVTLVDVTAEFEGRDTPHATGRACDGIVVVVDDGTSLARASEAIAQARRAAGVVTVVFVRGG